MGLGGGGVVWSVGSVGVGGWKSGRLEVKMARLPDLP